MNVKTKEGSTPISSAAYVDRALMIKKLVAAGKLEHSRETGKECGIVRNLI